MDPHRRLSDLVDSPTTRRLTHSYQALLDSIDGGVPLMPVTPSPGSHLLTLACEIGALVALVLALAFAARFLGFV